MEHLVSLTKPNPNILNKDNMTQFSSFGLPPTLVQKLEQMKYNFPTPIQQQAIPIALEGKDILGSAQTGTGKTGAFAIPLVASLINNPSNAALVMTPTRELAMQVMGIINTLIGKNPSIHTALLIGGESMSMQFKQLRGCPRVIVGTPGRINDHLERGTLKLQNTTFFVLDETDRMLDMGFEEQIERIVRFLPKTRQTLMFSATLPVNISKLSNKYLTNPVRIAVGSTTTPIENIKQQIIYTTDEEKYGHLVKEINNRSGSILIFVKTRRGAKKLSDKLNQQNHSTNTIHGDLRQREREHVIKAFRDSKFRIMVATDIASRGLDIPHIEHVINFDLPQCPEDYIHRIGRTARAGAQGEALCFISPSDRKTWKAIHQLVNPGMATEPKAPSVSRSTTPTNQKHGSQLKNTGRPSNGKPIGFRRRTSKNQTQQMTA